MYDVDDDADGVCTAKELQDVKDLHFSLDTDGDGLYNYLDADDDNDGQLTLVEEKVWENNKITPYLYKAPNASDVQKTDYFTYTEQEGFTNYELTNHLGNVMAVITDAPEAQNNTLPTVKSYADYWPFGAPLSIASGGEGYRFGFGGHENDPEPKGDGNFVDFGNYGLDVRIGRRWQQDPMAHTFPWESPYSTFFNNPINLVDPTGMSPTDWIRNKKNGRFVFNEKVTSKLNTPVGYNYVGKKDDDIVKYLFNGKKTFKTTTWNFGVISFDDFDNPYSASGVAAKHLYADTFMTVTINANTTYKYDENDKPHKIFTGLNFNVNISGDTTQESYAGMSTKLIPYNGTVNNVSMPVKFNKSGLHEGDVNINYNFDFSAKAIYGGFGMKATPLNFYFKGLYMDGLDYLKLPGILAASQKKNFTELNKTIYFNNN